MLFQSLKQRVKPYTWLRYMLAGGHMQGDELQHSRRFFSQFGEDAILENFFWGKSLGFYIEVGAFDPLVYSNTYWFYAKGWRGICIEPNPELFEKFRARRPGDTVLNLAVSRSTGEAEFVCAGPYSGILDDNFAVPTERGKGPVIRVPTRPLRDVLAANLPDGVALDFMSVDCEGHDLTVLESNNWELFRPSVVLVEDHSGDPNGPVMRRMCEWNYEPLHRVGLTMLFKAREFVPA